MTNKQIITKFKRSIKELNKIIQSTRANEQCKKDFNILDGYKQESESITIYALSNDNIQDKKEIKLLILDNERLL